MKSAAKKENWDMLCENDAELEVCTAYFDTIDGVYY